MILNRHKKCLGIKLFQYKNKLVEIWFCAPGFEIEQHSHPDINIELTFLFGAAIFNRWREGKETRKVVWPRDIFTTFTILPDTPHTFKVLTKWLPLVFINFEKWNTETPTSAAENFKLTYLP